MRGGAPAVARASSASPASRRGWWTGAARRPRCCPSSRELLEGRVLVAHNARFDTPRASAGVRARRAGLARAARAVHGGAGAALRAAGAPARAGVAGRLARASRSSAVHRALPGRARPARACFCALFPRLCATRPRSATRVELLRSPPAARASRSRAARRSPGPSAPTSPRSRRPRASTCSATSAGGRCTWASRCRCARAPARTSAPPRAGPSGPRSWTTAHQLRARRARAGEPADQGVAAAGQPHAQAHRPLGVPALPAGHSLPGARGVRRAGRGQRREHRAAARRASSPPSWPTTSPRCTGCATAVGR